MRLKFDDLGGIKVTKFGTTDKSLEMLFSES